MWDVRASDAIEVPVSQHPDSTFLGKNAEVDQDFFCNKNPDFISRQSGEVKSSIVRVAVVRAVCFATVNIR